MKRLLIMLNLLLPLTWAGAQNCYWVFLVDKAGTTFDPCSYFDAKAIERYRQCGADLYDITNYPLNQDYVNGIDALASEPVGSSRWMNAHAVMATPDQAAAISQLPYVLRVQIINGEMQLASVPADLPAEAEPDTDIDGLAEQLVRMQGQFFRQKGIDGHGIRIAVFDGGFPRVNTHVVFKHLRDEGRILKTWNFPNNKENVYGWNSHGTMTLSCIAGRIGKTDLGLATGAEFLLARTEVNTEPFKEEVWWMQAVEWADKNGANLISSSLGYGKERHYTRDMDGTSYVAKAGNLAARKGMLVCNSAGNEASDRQWRTIITPSDADSVLCVGGIEHSLTDYRHISFSSLGPSADGRLKPNVCAYGHARTASVSSDNSTHYVDGTSFSCPLVAGFAACAWQLSPGKTAMEMMHELEHSADLYPYFDYAFGYGVPQASYFTGDAVVKQPSFNLVETADSVLVVPTTTLNNTYIFYNVEREDGQLEQYGSTKVVFADPAHPLGFDKKSMPAGKLNISFDGYYASVTPSGSGKYSPAYLVLDERQSSVDLDRSFARRRPFNTTSSFGSNAKYRYDLYFQYGVTPNTSSDELTVGYSDAVRVGARLLRAFSKSYCIGLGIEYGLSNYNFSTSRINALDQGIISPAILPNLTQKQAELSEWSIEIFQRVRFVAGSMLSGRGLYWDLGLYGSKANNRYNINAEFNDNLSLPCSEVDATLRYLNALSAHTFNWGLTTRVGYSIFAAYARYRMTGIFGGLNDDQVLLPRLELGLQIDF